MSLEPAARLHDPVTHTQAVEGRFIAETALDVVLLFVPGPDEIIFIKYVYRGGSVLVRWAVKKMVHAANEKLTEQVSPREWAKKGAKKVVGDAGEEIGKGSIVVAGHVVTGSENVFTNLRNAARVNDQVDCSEHSDSAIALGSDCVSINLRPAARRNDSTKCGGTIADGSPDVIMGGVPVPAIGGKPGTKAAEPEVPEVVKLVKDVLLGAGKGLHDEKSLEGAGKGALEAAEDHAKEAVTDPITDATKDATKDALNKSGWFGSQK